MISRHKWFTQKIGNKLYACSRINNKYVYMHRLIMGLECGDSRKIDHIDGDGLNNTRNNLRVCTHRQNLQNRGCQHNCSSGLKGAYKCTASKTWMSRICVNGKDIYLGTFKTSKNAAEAYKRAARKHFGEFANV